MYCCLNYRLWTRICVWKSRRETQKVDDLFHFKNSNFLISWKYKSVLYSKKQMWYVKFCLGPASDKRHDISRWLGKPGRKTGRKVGSRYKRNFISVWRCGCVSFTRFQCGDNAMKDATAVRSRSKSACNRASVWVTASILSSGHPSLCVLRSTESLRDLSYFPRLFPKPRHVNYPDRRFSPLNIRPHFVGSPIIYQFGIF